MNIFWPVPAKNKAFSRLLWTEARILVPFRGIKYVSFGNRFSIVLLEFDRRLN